MKQLKIINELKQLLIETHQIETAFLYGSFARQNPTINSDIDIAIVVNNDFDIEEMLKVFQNHFSIGLLKILRVDLRNKIVLYFNELPKVEIAFSQNISEYDRNYLGSEISIDKISDSILFDRKGNALQHFNTITVVKESLKDKNKETEISNLINKFGYEFESCSAMHRRSDGYQFYFFYNIALQVAIQLNHFSKGHSKFNFLPKYFIANILTKEEQDPFYSLRGTLFLPEANQQKRKLLDFFYSAINSLVTTEKQNEVKQFCETIFDRDFFWNFRDISTHNPKLKSGKIFRTATMTFFQNETRFNELLNNKKIKTVIDLRADKEIEEMPYSDETLSKFNYVKTQLDPWNQPKWFKENHNQGTNEEIAYRYFAIGCNDKIKKAMEAIINEQNGSVAIHCFAGKDRTGIFISLLHLLAETPIEIINADYLASEVDVKIHRLNLVLDIINGKGGIEPYLLSCGLSENQIFQLKQKLLK